MVEWITWYEKCHTYMSIELFGIPWLDEAIAGILFLFMLYWLLMYGPRPAGGF